MSTLPIINDSPKVVVGLSNVTVQWVDKEFSTAVPPVITDFPLTNFIPEITDIPNFDTKPVTVKTTSIYSQIETYINGIPDLGQSLSFVCNLTDSILDEHALMMTAQNAVTNINKRLWFCIHIIPIKRMFVVAGQLSPIYFSGGKVADKATTNINVIPNGSLGFIATP